MPIKPCEMTYEGWATSPPDPVRRGPTAPSRRVSPTARWADPRSRPGSSRTSTRSGSSTTTTSSPGGSPSTWTSEQAVQEGQDIIQKAANEESLVRWTNVAKERRGIPPEAEERLRLADRHPDPRPAEGISAQVRKTVWPKMEELVGKELMDKVYKNPESRGIGLDSWEAGRGLLPPAPF